MNVESKQEQETSKQLLDKINAIAAKQQQATDFNKDGIALEFYGYADGLAIRLRDRFTQSTVYIVAEPWQESLEKILASIQSGTDIVRAVAGHALLS